ncbi:hypothetical protein N9917_01590 [Deltaproteobacteria bacterium]|nr:hypothetical protein [Deltaproteobacteria bacterium]
MRLLIPSIGTVLMLTEDWTFDLYAESRNQKFANQPLLDLGFTSYSPWEWKRDATTGQQERVPIPPVPVTLPKGTQLKVSRIYIRNGGKDMKSFDSVTFYCNSNIKGKKGKTVIKGRFWAKLLDVNSMDVAFDAQTMPIPEYTAVSGG